MLPSRGVLVPVLAAAACTWLAVGATGGGQPVFILARSAQAEVRALKGEERAGAAGAGGCAWPR